MPPRRWRRSCLSLTFLAFHAFDSAHAIVLTLVRLAVTKRRLLEWETAAAAAAQGRGTRRPQGGLRRFVAEMVASPIIAAAVVLTAMIAWRPGALPAASPFLVLWAMAPGDRLLAERAGRRARAPARRRRARAAAADGAQDLAVLRNVRHRSRRRGCRPTTFRRASDAPRAGAAHVADQHRHGPAVDHGRARSRLSDDRRAAAAARCDADDAGRARTLSRSLPELVRHVDAGAAAPAVRLDGRQRQPRRRADRAGAGAARARTEAADTGTAARRAGRRRQSPRRGVVVRERAISARARS